MKQILIVDDNLTNLEQISIHIEDIYDISLAKSGAQALQICGRNCPDLILLDIEMPELDGFQTLAKLRENHSLANVPVIFLTASQDIRTEIKALNAGASDFISKPVEREILLHRINTHLSLASSLTKLDNLTKDLEDALIGSFADIIEHRSEAFPGMALRVSKFVKLLGNDLLSHDSFSGLLNANNVDLMARAAPFHDIGKIAINDGILLKPSMLNDEEFVAMKTHTTLGAAILTNLFQRLDRKRGFEDYAITMAHFHHERWDGKGYPQGLVGENIPLSARVMAVADVFDAVIASRSYKKAMSFTEACRIILSGAGTIFDPTVISAFLNVRDEFKKIVEESAPND
ncbi:MAG: response regulator [Deltaproteobacteria bacterium]|jgi:putative two-component system response regulator|nr:response regulator [Deltaproteobacteria bacterium]